MQAFLFYLFYGFTWLISKLPRRCIYILSDFVFVIMYHLVGYRKKVVWKNLKNSFPEKTDKELKTIERKFYRHLSDVMLETVVLLHSKPKRALKYCKFNNLELFEHYLQKNQSVVFVSGHYGNWELYALMGNYLHHDVVGIYKPLSNPRYDKIMKEMRSRLGGIPAPMNDTLRVLIEHKRSGEPMALGLVVDQTPAKKDIHYWTTFLNQPTAVFLGTEKLSQKFNLPVIFSIMTKVKRGHYEVDFELLTETPNDFAPYELTDLHVKRLEQHIMEAPQYWLWSHKRWKIKPQENITQTTEQ